THRAFLPFLLHAQAPRLATARSRRVGAALLRQGADRLRRRAGPATGRGSSRTRGKRRKIPDPFPEKRGKRMGKGVAPQATVKRGPKDKTRGHRVSSGVGTWPGGCPD